MRLLLWPVAMLLLIVWSLVAWLLFGASDWLAGLVGSASAGILSADLGPWAQWLTESLGTIVQIGIVAVWAVVAIFILSLPFLLRRKHSRPEYVPAGYEQGFRDRGFRHGGWRDRDAWRDRTRYGYAELGELRHMALDMADQYRDKKWKKKKYRDKDRDDD